MNDQIPKGAIDAPDSRDYRAEHILGADTVEIPEVIRLDIKEGNQGDSVMCTCFASYHAAQVANELEHKKKLTPDFDKGWELQKEFGTSSAIGDYVQTALKSVVKNGMVTKDKIYKIDGYARIENSEIDTWLAKGYAVVTSMPVTNTNFKKAKYDGVWSGVDGTVVGGHAVTVVGREPGYKIVSNSYGPDWGYYKDGTFKVKDSDVKSLQTCYILYDAKDIDYIFKDVTNESPLYKEIKWAKDMGYVNGYQDGRFGPDDPITRAHICAILYRIFNK